MSISVLVDIVLMGCCSGVGLSAQHNSLTCFCRFTGPYPLATDSLSTLVQQFFPIGIRRNTCRRNELRDFVRPSSICS